MSGLLLITGACALFFLLKPDCFRKIKKEKRKDWIEWGLGVDCCCFYSRPFTVADQHITINGFQEVVDKNSPICYSLVKKNWWGKRTIFRQGLIHGDYKDSTGFQIIMENIPNDENYQIEVYNGFNISFGQFQVK
jgi:hypothetical protein